VIRVQNELSLSIKADSQFTVSGIAHILRLALSSINLLDEDYDALNAGRNNNGELGWVGAATRILNENTGKNWNSYYDRARYLDSKYGNEAYDY